MRELTKEEYLKIFNCAIDKKKDGLIGKKKNSESKNNRSDENSISIKINEEALKQALDIRKFEIEMYWKRATYFWTIIGVIFAGYFLLIKSNGLSSSPTLIFLVNCIGFIFSLSWFLVNRGSKFWQNNWERHVDLLEDNITGPLYKTVIKTGELKFWSIRKEYNYSVSKINQILSFYVTVIWLGMGLYLLIKQFLGESLWQSTIVKIFLLAALTAIAAIYLIIRGQTDVVNQNTKDESTIIRQREI